MSRPLALIAVLALLAPATAFAARGYVLTTDYTTGTLSVVDLATRTVACDVASVSPDPVARCHGGLLYVVNRYGYDNVQVIDPARDYATVLQFSVGNGTNPQDIAFASATRAYVSRLGSPDLLAVNPATGATLGSVSLAAWADADGNPEAAHLAVVGDLLFVALERLVNFAPADTGLVVVVDMRADTVFDADPTLPGVQAVKLAGLNPGTDFARPAPGAAGEPAHLWIGCTGQWGALDGGVDDIVVPAPAALSSEPIRSAGFVITEAALDGDVLDVDCGGTGHPYAIVSDASWNTSLVSWDPASGSRLGALYAPGGYSLSGAALDGRGELYVCNSNFSAPGLMVFAAGADTCLAGPLSICLPPVQIVFDPDSSAAAPGPPGEAVALGWPTPNPVWTSARLPLTLAAPGVARVEVFDLAGRRVRSLADGAFAAGTTSVGWDLADGSGRRVAAGIYLVRAESAGKSSARRIVVL